MTCNDGTPILSFSNLLEFLTSPSSTSSPPSAPPNTAPPPPFFTGPSWLADIPTTGPTGVDYRSDPSWGHLVRPCTRCVKRNIGHLCHDEPREPKKHKAEPSAPNTAHQEKGQDDQNNSSSPKTSLSPPVNGMTNPTEHQDVKPPISAGPSVSLPPPPLPVSRTVAPSAVSATSRPNMNANSQACMLGFFLK